MTWCGAAVQERDAKTLKELLDREEAGEAGERVLLEEARERDERRDRVLRARGHVARQRDAVVARERVGDGQTVERNTVPWNLDRCRHAQDIRTSRARGSVGTLERSTSFSRASMSRRSSPLFSKITDSWFNKSKSFGRLTRARLQTSSAASHRPSAMSILPCLKVTSLIQGASSRARS